MLQRLRVIEELEGRSFRRNGEGAVRHILDRQADRLEAGTQRRMRIGRIRTIVEGMVRSIL